MPNFAVHKFPSKYNSGWFTERVTIQASAPKVLHGTNYFGVGENDFDLVMQKLAASCNLVGLPITKTQLEQATLREIAFCFNFIFGDKFPYPLEYLKRMSFLDIGKRYDKVKNTDFVEETQGYQGKLYNGQVGWGLYDKRAQLFNDAKTQEELTVIDKMKQGLLPDKVLRMEITYQNQTSVKQHLTTRLGGTKQQLRHLGEVFNNRLAQGILTDSFDQLSQEVSVAALEMPIMPQETGTLPFKEMRDRYFRRQYRGRLDKSLAKILKLRPLPKSTLGQIFDICKKQLSDF